VKEKRWVEIGVFIYPLLILIQKKMETEDKISFNYTDGLNIHDDVYRKVIKDFNILYERDKMGEIRVFIWVLWNKTPLNGKGNYRTGI
jgi:hypothetical protein